MDSESETCSNVVDDRRAGIQFVARLLEGMIVVDSILSAPHTLEYSYRRSLGPVLGRFFGALRERRIEGVRTAAGRVLVPPTEYDPETGEATGEFVEVGPAGIVRTWAWVARPRPKHPLDRPFAWALIQLDGADTAMLHGVDAGSESAMHSGLRVVPRWRDEPQGGMHDIVCFEPGEATAG